MCVDNIARKRRSRRTTGGIRHRKQPGVGSYLHPTARAEDRKNSAGLSRGFRCERFQALFDIRHDFIKHSSNVQTLYIELYLPRFGAVRRCGIQ